MRPRGVSVAVLLLVSASLAVQASPAEDLYWEGEEDASNEFLEVKHEDVGISGHLMRLKRDIFDFLSPFTTSTSTTTQPPLEEVATDDPDADAQDRDEDLERGSGSHDPVDQDLKEKTLRVTFVVMEPYQSEYSNRDSEQFLSFSKAIADAVNLLYENLPGTQKASLVRIQSRISDEFSCKVTLDIVTTGYDNTDRIAQILQDHIRNRRELGSVTVSDQDFKTNVIDPGYTEPQCSLDEIQCSDDTCVSGTSRCNGLPDCPDGSDELGCPTFDDWSNQRNDQTVSLFDCERIACASSSVVICVDRRCDGVADCPEGDDENGCNDVTDRTPTTTEAPVPESTTRGPISCPPGAFACDETRCVSYEQRCDNRPDCFDGTDELGCESKSCGADDFRCDNGKCIEAARRCDRVVDCSNEEDEQNCECRDGEFRCRSDGSCIEGRKRCDGVNHCKDSSDELDCGSSLSINRTIWWGNHVCQSSGKFRCSDGTCISILLRCDGFRDCRKDGNDEIGCPCSPDQWQCDFGNCIKRSKRCDGHVDCPTDRSDERHCVAIGKFRCRTGKLIPEYLKCNRRYDCPAGDYSDEQHCPCGDGDFRCDNGNCIPESKHCDRTHDCQDGSDERDCIYGTVCMAFQYKCTSGQCVPADSLCNGTKECSDWSDERNCPCKRGQFACRDGSCINIALRCNGRNDCLPAGEDEFNCAAASRCPPDSFTCNPESSRPCARRCDGQVECDGGEDEDDCTACSHECDGICLDEQKICNGFSDCSDGSDELNCDHCDGPDDFRCKSGECINAVQYCNGIYECSDDSDELDCNKTMISKPDECSVDEYRCRDGTCINSSFYCDGRSDCLDNSDEDNCPWYIIRPSRSPAERQCHESEFTCNDGRCITHLRRCDNIYDCMDFSDEQNCHNSECDENQWQCVSGMCIPLTSYCDDLPDCPDFSDETACPTTRPWVTTTSRPIKENNNIPEITNAPPTQRPDSQYGQGQYGGQPGGQGQYGGQPEGPGGPYGGQPGGQYGGQPGGQYGGQPGGPYGGQPGAPEGPYGGQPGGQGQYGGQPEGPGGPYGGQPGGPYGGQPGGQYGGQPGGPYRGQPDRPYGGQQGAPEGPYGGQPGGQGQYGGQPEGPGGPYGGQPGGPYGGQPGGQYGGQPGGPYGGQPGGSYGGQPSKEDNQPSGPYGGQPNPYDSQTEGPYGNQPGDPYGSQPNDPYGSQPGDPYGSQPVDQGSPYDGQPGVQGGQYGSPGEQEGQPGGQGGPYDGQPGGQRNQYGGQPGEQGGQYGGQPGEQGGQYGGQPGGQGGQPGGQGGQYGGQPGGQGGQYGGQPGGQGGQPGGQGGQYGGQPGGQGGQYGGQPGGQGGQYGGQLGGGQYGGQPGGQGGQPGGQGSQPSGQGGQPGGQGDQYGSQPGGQGGQYGGQQGGQYGGQPGGQGNQYGGQPSGQDSTYGGQVDPYENQPSGQDQYGNTDGCPRNQWRCENGPCIESYRRCDGRIDCPLDDSDELDCPPGSPAALKLRTYPTQQSVRNRGDVVFQCRDEGPIRAPVRWVREGGRPLKPGATDRHGRLEINQVTTSDSGVYICQAVRYLGQPNAELKVTLNVDPTPVTSRPPQLSCQAYEATCGNGQCIPKSAVCNGHVDCADGSDEETCHMNGKCEPNQFKCANNKCVLKTWLCDSEDDCGDGSDELNCGYETVGQCKTVEYTCSDGNQCIPKSFHCDGQSDCLDGSDEIGCAPVYVTRPPQPSNVRLNTGDTLVLNCTATGTPTPLISWRRNWGDVPEVCETQNIQTNGQVVGVLTCPNMQPEYNGAYSCEAMNNKGTIFAVPDAIVFVNKTSVCPSGYFNSEARSERDCIRCFCFGESTQCHSADLFTYNMPTLLGEGGTRLVGVKNTGNGDVQLDTPAISNQYYYQPLRNGATVTKLAHYTNWGSSSALPYVTLPETYNGNQLTSYGGYIRYKLAPHLSRYGADYGLPDIIIKGKYQNLVHINRGSQNTIQARLTPDNWEKSSPNGLVPATREDIMMALDNIEMILLRASVNNAGVNITDFVMESAKHINMGLGVASLVEECSCPPGYEGLSCQKCAPGFSRRQSGPWLGNCEAEVPECPPGTYGDPASGYACRPCPCPLTNRENQFARTCAIGPDGNVLCDCAAGYEGPNCEYCAPNYVGNPLVIGDFCKPQPDKPKCNTVGTSHVRLPDDCECKDNVQGRYCDQCKNDSFYLSNDFRQGCALCFCSGVSQQCMSSNLRRKTTTARFNTPDVVSRVRIYSSTPLGASAAVRYNAPVETNLSATYGREELVLSDYDRSRPAIYYWSLPINFAGDKVTSYGGYLTYTLHNVPSPGSASKNNAADIQLISENHLTFHYFGNFEPSYDGTLEASVQFLERGWQRPDGKEVSREHFLLALADVKAILVKASYTTNSQLASLVGASIDTAEENGEGPPALHVEQCVCPTGYIGTSCEDCAPGYTRYESGLYLEHCGPCECNGHSEMCHPETGVCSDCRDNTAGDNCEDCKPGYRRDSGDNCVPEYPPTPCNCDTRGSSGPCDDRGYCQCKQNVEGANCDSCRPGTFGLDAANPLGCHSCYCSGVTSNCHEASSQYIRIPMAAPILGDDYGGYRLMDVNAQRVLSDHIVSMPTESELMYVFQFPPDEELFWSLPVFPGNRILSYGGTLQLKQKFESRDANAVSEPGTDVILVGEDKSVYWSNPQPIRAGQPLTYKVPLTEQDWFLQNYATPASRADLLSVLRSLKRVLVRATLTMNIESSSIADVSMDTATEMNDPAFPQATGVEICRCPDGYSGTSCESCTPGFYRDPSGLCQRCGCNGHDCYLAGNGQPVCNCRPPYTGRDCSILGEPSKQDNGTTRPPPPRTTVVVKITSPTIKIQEVGSSVNFTCQAQSRMTRGNLPVQWSKADGYLPQGRTQFDGRSGMLLITNLQISDSGIYICQTSDGISTARAEATLKVPGNDMTVPTAEIRPPISEYFEGDRIQLECVTSGNPAPSISWQRASGRPLPEYAEVIEDLFIIDSAREEDSGEYRCTAKNTAGENHGKSVVNVRPRPSLPQRDKLTVSQAAPTISEGQNTRVVCTGTANVPAGTIDWIRQDGTQLPTNIRSDNGVLYIDYAQLENQGVYICRTTSYDVAPVLVVVTVIPQGTPSPDQQPNITVSVNNLRIPTGESGTVECTPRGYPLPLIRWRKSDGEFGDSTSQRQNSLIIANAREEDKGYYQCEGIVDGQPVSIIYVYVDIERREKPQVEIWPQGEQALNLGSTFDLRCRVTGGVPEPTVTWSRSGGRPLSPFVQLQPYNILRFERVDVNDEGEYSCTASNIAGAATASATIKVRSPPEVTLSPSDYVQVMNGDPITVECRASGYPQPMVSIKTSNREIVPPSLGMAVLHISSATDRDDGDYTCSATSPAGTIEEQFGIRVDRGDGGFGLVEGSGEVYVEPVNPYQPNEQPSDLIAAEGKETRIGCDASGALDVQWSRADRRPLQPNAMQSGNSLIIQGTSKQDAGQYVCNLLDRYTGEVTKSATTSLVVMAAPRITLQPPTQTVHPGESPTVECVVEGDEIEEIVWRPVTRPFSSRVDVRRSTLIFNRIEVEDAGKYECFARNRVADTSATAEVVVSEETDRAPSESHDNEQYAHVGAAVQLSCNVQQSPAGYRISWTKNGAPLPRSVHKQPDGSLYIRLAQKSDSGHYVCNIQDPYGRRTSNYINLHIDGGDEALNLVSIEQPRRKYRVGENVEVLCRARSREDRVSWERYGTRQFVESRRFGDGAMLVVPSVQESDAGLYRCTGTDPYGRTSYEDFNLEVIPGSPVVWPAYPPNEVVQYTVRLGDSIDMPCSHNLEQPVSVEWRREYSPLQPDVRPNEPTLHLERIMESDAGTYVCRVSNSRTAVESRAVLRVAGVVPRFDGSGWISLPTLREAYRQFDIEISFKPIDATGLILFNGEKPDPSGDYIALQLIRGVPQFIVEVGSGPIVVDGDRPLQLNTWHTIRISKTNSKVTMDVDNNGPTSVKATGWEILELLEPLYIGGVPDYSLLPARLREASGFIGCVSMLILGREEKNIMMDRIEQSNVHECDSCSPNLCYKNGVCQEARNERGYICLCAAGFAGLNCDRTGEACRPGLCGPGKCTDTADGYKCACPVTFTGKNCDVKQSIEYPAFTGSAYLAIKAPKTSRFFRMSMKVKASSPVTDGIIMYCAESPRGYGGFTALTVHNGRLEFTYDIGDGSRPVVLQSNRSLPANEWTDVQVVRVGSTVTLTVNLQYNFQDQLDSSKNDMNLETPMFVGGVDDSIVLNKNTGVSGGFSGCIKDVMVYGDVVDIVGSSIQSANVQECSKYDRGDIPEAETICSQCRNGGECTEDGSGCICPYGWAGQFCETRVPPPARRPPGDPCALSPCRNGGSCRRNYSTRMNYTCDCPLGFAGNNCQMPLELRMSVGFNGNGYLELPAEQLRYETLYQEPAIIAIAFDTNSDGVLLYQREVQAAPNYGDFILIRIENGVVVMDWNLGGGLSTVSIENAYVTDGDRHALIAKLFDDGSVSLSVDGVAKNATSTGFSNLMNADSNIYVGGIPDSLNVNRYPGLTGCVEQIELMNSNRGINLGRVAVTGRNTQRCRNSRA